MVKSPNEMPFLAVFKPRLASANYMATPYKELGYTNLSSKIGLSDMKNVPINPRQGSTAETIAT